MTAARQQAIEALRPFAELADKLNPKDMAAPAVAKPETVLLSIGGVGIRAGDLYQARHAYKELTK